MYSVQFPAWSPDSRISSSSFAALGVDKRSGRLNMDLEAALWPRLLERIGKIRLSTLMERKSSVRHTPQQYSRYIRIGFGHV